MAKATGIAQFSKGRSDVHKVDPRMLVIEPGWNTRDEGPELDAHIDQLAQSIANNGFNQTKPISVKMVDGKLLVRDGHCRTRACIRAIEHYGADLVAVPVIPFDRYANDADMIVDQVISNSGKPLTPLEEARVYKKLLDLGWQQSVIAQKVGKSSGRISQILDLLTMPASVQSAVAAGEISATLANKVVKSSENAQAATAAVSAAVQTAKAEGRSKATAVHTNSQPKFTLKQCFENSEIDYDNSDETGYCEIRMPVEEWEFIRDLFKL